MIPSAYVANRQQCDQPIELPQLGLSWTRQHHDSEKSFAIWRGGLLHLRFMF